MAKKYLVGSTYFFKDMENFISKDVDYVILEGNPKDFKINYQITGKGQCLFRWKKMSSKEFIAHTLKSKLPMEAGKFLVKELSERIGMTIEDLKQLAPAFEKIDEKHSYQRIIFDSYIENNKFELTEEQRLKAYEEYKRTRNL